MNTVNLIGRWTRDHELRFTQSGTAVLKNSIAVDRPFSKEKETDFFDVTVFGKIAENAANYTDKGRLVGITGRLQQDKWTTEEGHKRSRVCIIADRVDFLEWKDKSDDSHSNSESDTPGFEPMSEDDPDDVPF